MGQIQLATETVVGFFNKRRGSHDHPEHPWKCKLKTHPQRPCVAQKLQYMLRGTEQLTLGHTGRFMWTVTGKTIRTLQRSEISLERALQYTTSVESNVSRWEILWLTFQFIHSGVQCSEGGWFITLWYQKEAPIMSIVRHLCSAVAVAVTRIATFTSVCDWGSRPPAAHTGLSDSARSNPWQGRLTRPLLSRYNISLSPV